MEKKNKQIDSAKKADESIFVLVEDRRWNNEPVKFCEVGTEFECMVWILDHTSHSFSMALEHQGYKLLKV